MKISLFVYLFVYKIKWNSGMFVNNIVISLHHYLKQNQNNEENSYSEMQLFSILLVNNVKNKIIINSYIFCLKHFISFTELCL